MKTLSKFGFLFVLGGSLVLSSCAGSYYIAEQPIEPVYSRPVTPYNGAVWITGEWVWNGGRYTYRNGYWAKPRNGHVYVSGTWVRTGRGYTWHRGNWR